MKTAITDPKSGALDASIKEKVLLGGDLSALTEQQRLAYYSNLCESLGLNPLTRPFEYIILNGKLTLYARKDATDQLRKIHEISIEIKDRRLMGDTYEVLALASMLVDSSGRVRADESIGAVFLPEKGESRANAIMKAETKAKRRVTLSICGLGWTDEAEVETIPGAVVLTTKPLEQPAPVQTKPEAGKTPVAEQKPPTRAKFVKVIQEKIKELNRENTIKWFDEHALAYEGITDRNEQEKYYNDLIQAIKNQSEETNAKT